MEDNEWQTHVCGEVMNTTDLEVPRSATSHYVSQVVRRVEKKIRVEGGGDEWEEREEKENSIFLVLFSY